MKFLQPSLGGDVVYLGPAADWSKGPIGIRCGRRNGRYFASYPNRRQGRRRTFAVTGTRYNEAMPKPAVLVVDDEPDISELLSITLQRMDLSPRTADTVAAAQRLLKTERFDLCLTDMQLPTAMAWNWSSGCSSIHRMCRSR